MKTLLRRFRLQQRTGRAVLNLVVCLMTGLIFFGCDKVEDHGFSIGVVTLTHYKTGVIDDDGKEEIILQGMIAAPKKVDLSDHGFKIYTENIGDKKISLGGTNAPGSFTAKIYLQPGDHIIHDSAYACYIGNCFTKSFEVNPNTGPVAPPPPFPLIVADQPFEVTGGVSGEIQFSWSLSNFHSADFEVVSAMVRYESSPFPGTFVNSQPLSVSLPSSNATLGNTESITGLTPGTQYHVAISIGIRRKTAPYDYAPETLSPFSTMDSNP